MRKILCVLALGALLAVSLVPLSASAAVFRGGEQYSLSNGERVLSDLYIGGGRVIVNGSVVGDLVAAGGDVLITGSSSQDMMVAGGSVSVMGQVGDDLRVVGGDLLIGGEIKGDVVIAGGSVKLLPDMHVFGDVVIAGGSVVVDGKIDGGVRVRGGDVSLAGSIKGEVSVHSEKLTVQASAVIEKNLEYTSPKEAVIMPGATIKGKVDFQKSEPLGSQFDREGLGKALIGVITALAVLKFLALLALSLVVGLVFHKASEALVRESLLRFWPELGRGFVAAVVIPVLIIILFVTLLGTLLGGTLAVFYIGLLMLGKAYSGVLFGSWLFKLIEKTEHAKVNWKTITVGVIVLSIISLIPIAGWIVRGVFCLVVIGAMVRFLHTRVWQER